MTLSLCTVFAHTLNVVDILYVVDIVNVVDMVNVVAQSKWSVDAFFIPSLHRCTTVNDDVIQNLFESLLISESREKATTIGLGDWCLSKVLFGNFLVVIPGDISKIKPQVILH